MGDSGIEITKQHSDKQTVVKGGRHREWSWMVVPKSTGEHAMTVTVRAADLDFSEDYDPETMKYDVEFNFWNWFDSGLQQNGWTVIIVVVTNVVTAVASFFVARRKATT